MALAQQMAGFTRRINQKAVDCGLTIRWIVFFILLTMTLGVGFTSCSNEDDGSNSSYNNKSSNNGETETFAKIGTTISVTKDTAASTILNLTENTTLVVTGGVNTVTINQIGIAMKENTSPKIALDLSGTTGMTEIPKSGFEGCTGLYSIKLPSTLVSIGDYAFKKCSSLVNITIPDSVTSFGGTSTFQDCTSLKNAVLGSGIPHVRWYLFSGCSSLEAVTFRGSYSYDGFGLWDNCTSLKELIVYGSVAENSFKDLGITLEKVTLGSGNSSDSITIEKDAFRGTQIKSIIIKDGVVQLYASAFTGNVVTSITFENTNGWYLPTEKYVSNKRSGYADIDVDVTNPITNVANWKKWNQQYITDENNSTIKYRVSYLKRRL